MFWQKQKLEYAIIIPPLEKKVNQLSKSEAREYFDWFTSKLCERVEYLRQYTNLNLDYSSESLVKLWAWFINRAEIEYTPKDRLQALEKELVSINSPLTARILAGSTKQFTLETEYIMIDIAMYWGELFTKTYPSIYWGYYTHPKEDAFVNRPVLLGFPNEIFPEKAGIPFEPIHMVNVQASKILRGTASKRDLLAIHQIWADKIM